MQPIYIDYLNALDIAELALTDDEIIGAVEAGLAARAAAKTVIEPRVHSCPAVARPFQRAARRHSRRWISAGVKVVGDFVDNYRQGLPREFGILNLFDPRTGTPRAILDATAITEMRTGAVTAVGAKHLAPPKPQDPRPYRGARHRLLERAAARPALRLRRDPRPFAPARKPRPLRGAALGRPRQAGACRRQLGGLRARAPTSWSRRPGSTAPEPLLKTDWIKPGALVIPYGTMSAVELSLTDIMGKMVVDDWGQCRQGPFGALRAHVEAGHAVARRRCMPNSGRSWPG